MLTYADFLKPALIFNVVKIYIDREHRSGTLTVLRKVQHVAKKYLSCLAFKTFWGIVSQKNVWSAL